MHEYSQAVSGQGAAVLMDGRPMTIEQIIQALSDFDRLKFNVSSSFAVLDKLRGELEQMKQKNAEMIKVIMEMRTGISKEEQAKVLLDAATDAKIKQLETLVSSLRSECDQWEGRCLKETSTAVDLGLNLDEHHRLHRELAKALGHDAEAPSLGDLVAVARLVKRERDELATSLQVLRALFREGFDSCEDHDLLAWEIRAKQALDLPESTHLAEVRARAVEDAVAFADDVFESEGGNGCGSDSHHCATNKILAYANRIRQENKP